MRYTSAHTMDPALIGALHHLGIGLPTQCITRTAKDQTRSLIRVTRLNAQIRESDHSKQFWRRLAQELGITSGAEFIAVWDMLCGRILTTSGIEIAKNDQEEWELTGREVAGSFFESGWYNTLPKPENKVTVFHRHLQRAIGGKKMRWEKCWIDHVSYRIPVHCWSDLTERLNK